MDTMHDRLTAVRVEDRAGRHGDTHVRYRLSDGREVVYSHDWDSYRRLLTTGEMVAVADEDAVRVACEVAA